MFIFIPLAKCYIPAYVKVYVGPFVDITFFPQLILSSFEPEICVKRNYKSRVDSRSIVWADSFR